MGDDQRVIVFANTKRQVGGKLGWTGLRGCGWGVSLHHCGSPSQAGGPTCGLAGLGTGLSACARILGRGLAGLGVGPQACLSHHHPLLPHAPCLPIAVRCRHPHPRRHGLPRHHAARRQEPGPARGVDQGGCLPTGHGTRWLWASGWWLGRMVGWPAGRAVVWGGCLVDQQGEATTATARLQQPQ